MLRVKSDEERIRDRVVDQVFTMKDCCVFRLLSVILEKQTEWKNSKKQ